METDKQQDEISNLFIKHDIIDELFFKNLFCQTIKGKEAMIRQLEPTMLIENNIEIIKNVHPYVVYVVQIKNEKEEFVKIKNVLNLENLKF
eukprot:gene6586-10749_t